MSARRRWLWTLVSAVIVQLASSDSIVIIEGECSPCYRRLLTGKKSLELHVRRAVECERIEDCHRACDYEKFFICEGFNYRHIGHGAKGMCEMTSIPYSRMDLHRDFITDPQCDYYEKDPNCVANTLRTTQATRWNQSPRPTQSYGPPSNGRPNVQRPYAPDRRPLNELPRPLDHDRRPFKEIPRPLDYDRRPVEHNRQSPVNYEFHRVLYDDSFGQRNVYSDDRDLIRTGYPVLRPEDQFSNGGRFPPRRLHNDDFYERNWARGPKYPDRRTDHGPTYDIGTNEIGTYGPPDPGKDRHWGSYGAIYGGSYGYDTNYVGKFDVPKYYPRPKLPQPYDNEHFYGEFYNYGGAFGYGDTYIPADQDPLYGGSGKGTEECSVRAGAGFRLSRGVVRKTYLTPNLDQCESLCINERSYTCMSFSYRYNVAPTDPTDNCLLSDVSYKDLNFYTDLEPDRDYDIYAMIANSRSCGAQRELNQQPPDECFWRVRSGFGMPADVVRKSAIVDNLGACQVECATSRDFTCRSFAFKYGLEHGRQDDPRNCYLSDWPSQDINPSNMPDMDGAELYERGSFGRGCEPYTVPFFNTGRFNDKKSPRGDEVCYSGYDKPCKLTPYAVLLATYVNSEQDCRQKCSGMRESNSIPCMSYSYKLTAHGTEENCLLSDVPIRDLRPGLDYTYDDNHVLYAWKDLDPHCVITGYSIDDDHVFGGAGPARPLPAPSRPDFNPDANYPSSRPGDIYPDTRPFSRPNGQPHHAVRPFDPDRPDPVRPYRPGGSHSGYGDKFGHGAQPGGYGYGSSYPNEYSTFRYFTVNGYPCKRGTKCERNKIAGFWACETEGSEYGSWDYCCAPSHNCGFSQGYHYPWCYVGASEDQWRPCSEKYFPYLPSPRPIRPMIDGEHRHDRPDPQDPNHSRHWPITYWHREPPPNCTDSLASADNSEHRRQNETIPATIEKSTSTMAGNKNGSETGTTIARTRQRRLRSRMTFVNKDAQDSRATFSRKDNNQTSTTHTELTSRERVATIRRVLKPSTVTFAAALGTNEAIGALSTKIGGASNGAVKYESAKNESKMIRVPLITPNNWNNSVPTAA